MINKIKKILFGSITRELLIVNVISVILIVAAATTVAYISASNQNTIENLVNNFNSLYVDAGRVITSRNENCAEYLGELAEEYDTNAAITDMDGNIIMKSKNIIQNKIDMNKIHDFLVGSYKDGNTFYQVYNMKLDSEDCKLIVFKSPKSQESYARYLLYLLIALILFIISTIYILTRKKAKYIKNICSGIKNISGGNLDFRIESRGEDELSVLADEINIMSENLKTNIEEERKSERLKSELITNVSHDLRTPLTALTAYLQLANDSKTTIVNKEKYTRIAEEKAHKLKTLIEDLFEYSKLESGGISLNKEDVNIIEIIEQNIGELSMQAKERNISFKKNFQDSSIILNVDSAKMARVFENIISNAVKYSIINSVVDINVEAQEKSVVFSFENITDVSFDEDADKIFERFYRDDKSRNSEQEGSGLGLAIAKSIVALHGGEISAKVLDNTFIINIKIYK